MSKRPSILLTNDDGHDSPLFLHTIDVLRELGDLTIAVPANEQSWCAKAMTRVGVVEVQEITLCALPAYMITGTPADCVNVAIHNLMNTKPACVISGTNIGGNIGLSYMLSSGTVGACIEGNIAGVPALALSQHLIAEVFQEWMQTRTFHPITLAYLKSLTDTLIPRIWSELTPSQIREPITWNVNFPYTVIDPTVAYTRLGQSFYNQCFQQNEAGAYRHDLKAFEFDSHPRSDAMVVRNGRISATRLDIRTLGQNLELSQEKHG